MPNRIEISLLPGNKRIAVTTSWDDGPVEDRRLIQFFNTIGLRGTFNLNSDKLGRTGKANPASREGCIDASEVAALYAGHEVAIHTSTHSWLDRLEPSQIAAEVLNDRKALEDLVGYPVRGMAYPFGTYDARVIEVLRGLGIAYCRTVENREPCFPPVEPLAWAATCHMYHPELLSKWEAFHSNSWASGLFFVWGHSYEFDRKNDWAGLERIFRPLSGKPDVWYCTNIELFDYEVARKRLAVAANRKSIYNPSAIAVTIVVDGVVKEVRAGELLSLQ